MTEKEWFWCSDWCRRNGLSPFFERNWDKAREKYKEYESQGCLERQVCEDEYNDNILI